MRLEGVIPQVKRGGGGNPPVNNALISRLQHSGVMLVLYPAFLFSNSTEGFEMLRLLTTILRSRLAEKTPKRIQHFLNFKRCANLIILYLAVFLDLLKKLSQILVPLLSTSNFLLFFFSGPTLSFSRWIQDGFFRESQPVSQNSPSIKTV